jgi:hypothetical protein
MPSLTQRLRLLRGRDPHSVAAVLAPAIMHGETDEMEAIIRAATATGRPDVLATALAHAHRVDGEGAALFTAGAGATTRALRAAIARALAPPRERVALNVLDVIRRRGDTALLCFLDDLVSCGLDRVVRAAAHVVLETTIAHLGPSGRRIPPPAARDELDATIAAVARSYREHRAEPVLLAVAVASARPGRSLARLLEDRDHPIVAALRGVGDRVTSPVVRRNLIRWLGDDRMSTTAARWLHRLDDAEAWGDALADGHLLLAPRRRSALRRLVRPLQCVPPIDVATAMPRRAQMRLPALIHRVHLSSRARRQHLADLIALPSPIARLRAIAGLGVHLGPQADETLGLFARDRDRSVAHVAAQELGRRLAEDASAGAALERCPHVAVARRARARLARASADGLRLRWGRLPEPDRLAAALAVREIEPAALPRLLAETIDGATAAGGEEAGLAAIRLARRLGLVADLEEILMRVAAAESPRVASAAVAALGGARTGQRLGLLIGALGHRNERVRANAIEALGRSARSPHAATTADHVVLDALRPALRSHENRCRANAVRALLGARSGGARPVAAAALRSMLGDESPLHRVSAIWVARRTRRAAVDDDLRRLARADPFPIVRRRAQAALRFRAAPDPVIAAEAPTP